jgi:hypothetical protein
VGAALVALWVYGHRLLQRSNRERHDLLLPLVGRDVRLVTLTSKAFTSARTGTLRQVDHRAVVVRSNGRDVSVPMAAIQEVWRGSSRLGRW